MIFIKTVYPCHKCQADIEPVLKFCPDCGTDQPNLNQRVHYTLVTRHNLGEPYRIKYGGDILTLEDITDLLSGDPASENYTNFIVGYIPAANTVDGQLTTVSTYAVSGRYRSDKDHGESVFPITALE